MAATPNQIRANRLNAQKSTGPRTPEGKARSSQNGTTHGLYAQSPLALSIEDQEQAEQLRTALRDQHQPVNPTEEFLLAQLTQAAVRLQRLSAIEHGHWENEIHHTLQADAQRAGTDPVPPECYQDQPELFRDSLLAAVARNEADRDCGGTDFFTKLTRQRSAAERTFYKSLQALEQAKRHRPQTEEVQTKANHPQTGVVKPAAPKPLTLVPSGTKTTSEAKPKSEPNTPQMRDQATDAGEPAIDPAGADPGALTLPGKTEFHAPSAAVLPPDPLVGGSER